MEDQSLFELSVDPLSQDNLYQTARWGKFLSIVGFIGIGFMILFGFFFRPLIYSSASLSSMYPSASIYSVTVSYVLMGILYFFPTFFLYRFSSQMLQALANKDQHLITSSFSQLKACFKFVGILTIIVMVLAILGIVILVIVGSMFLQH